jgi:hypothetical protein
MREPAVGKVWWQNPGLQTQSGNTGRGRFFERVIFPRQTITFGRHRDASIRIGYGVDPDNIVPRWWGQLRWDAARLRITNLDDKWGFELVPEETVGATMAVPPQAEVSPPASRFRIVAIAPTQRHELHVACSPPRTFVVPAEGVEAVEVDPPSHLPFALSEQEVLIGQAILAFTAASHSRRPSYEAIGRAIHLSVSRVREIVRDMDSLFLMYGLSPGDGDALDRVTMVARSSTGLFV